MNTQIFLFILIIVIMYLLSNNNKCQREHFFNKKITPHDIHIWLNNNSKSNFSITYRKAHKLINSVPRSRTFVNLTCDVLSSWCNVNFIPSYKSVSGILEPIYSEFLDDALGQWKPSFHSTSCTEREITDHLNNNNNNNNNNNDNNNERKYTERKCNEDNNLIIKDVLNELQKDFQINTKWKHGNWSKLLKQFKVSHC